MGKNREQTLSSAKTTNQPDKGTMPFQVIVSCRSRSYIMQYISKSKTAYKISVPTPSGETVHRTLGFIKKGEHIALAEAEELRDEIGEDLWGEFWLDILADPKLLLRLPTHCEPLLCEETDEKGNKRLIYRAMWSEWSNQNKRTRKCRKRSVDLYGFDGAYDLCKQVLIEAYEQYVPIMEFMTSQGSNRFEQFSLN